ncbi:hypothetical protein ACFIOY_36880 [Bradyrhizobium sp. TZ2]
MVSRIRLTNNSARARILSAGWPEISAMRRAFENDAPFAARSINSAAEYVDEAAEKIRSGSVCDLVDGATDFARRQPAAFLGLSVLAGFAAVRFLKASGSQASSSSSYRGEAS